MSSWFKKSTPPMQMWLHSCFLFQGLLTFHAVTVDFFLAGGVGMPTLCSQGSIQRSPVEETQQSGFCGWKWVFCSLPFSCSGFLGKLLWMCGSCVWMSLASQRVKWNPQRKTFYLIFSLLLQVSASFMFVPWKVPGAFWRIAFPYAGLPLLNQSCSPVN